MANITFVYIMSFIMTRHLKNPCGRPWYIRLHTFRPNLAQIACLPTKRIFKTKLTNITFVQLLCFIMLKHFKKILATDHEIKGCVRFWANLVQNYWFALRGDVFFGILTNVILVHLLCFNMIKILKKNLTRDHEI